MKKHDAATTGRMPQVALRVVEVLEGKYVKPEKVSKKRKRGAEGGKKRPAKKAKTTEDGGEVKKGATRGRPRAAAKGSPAKTGKGE